MVLYNENEMPLFLVEDNAERGIYEIAVKVARDMEMVSGRCPLIIRGVSNLPADKSQKVVLFATLQKSALVKELPFDNSKIKDKWEVYQFSCYTSDKLAGTSLSDTCRELLVICGSDKRGTIYGMFHLSELMGVSPLVFWGDAVAKPRRTFEITSDMEVTSKEPSVRYRGFFINDEWPCFGNWTTKHYGGFTAEMYDHVFELLLRLRGNYMWPAMWSSSFALDGPGEASAELADLYGVIIGNSHHEPCLRAGEEWDIYKGEDTIYGTQWNYMTNAKGLLNFWRDGLIRSGRYESIITVGMRGERDSMLEGPNSLAENIEVLKEIITEQKKLIKEYGNQNGRRHPLLLAIYKEVERYYYGDETVQGLKDWEGLEDVILMFCEDNFGHMRYLPRREQKHSGGYGMYYHLDYHGDPISYEWVNSTPLSSIWEQMTIAYEQGVKEVWIVNVGDLKGNEFPLNYFMDLAFDYEKWGSSAVNATRQYTREWLERQFGDWTSMEWKDTLTEVLTEGIRLIGRKRPEALTEETYGVGINADHILEQIDGLEKQLLQCEGKLPKECQNSFYSMIADPLRMGFNLIRLQIYAGKNHHYAKQGKTLANTYAKRLRECIAIDRKLIENAGDRNGGKWKGMWDTSHIGFQKWNEDGCRYPVIMNVEPFSRPRMLVSKKGELPVFQKNYGTAERMEIWDFIEQGAREVCIEIANDGCGSFAFTVEKENCDWLETEVCCQEVKEQEYLWLRLRENVKAETSGIIRICSGDIQVDVEVFPPTRTFEQKAKRMSREIAADNYISAGKDIIKLSDFGLYGTAVKAAVFESTLGKNVRTEVTYQLEVPATGADQITLIFAPSNPIDRDIPLAFEWSIDDGKCMRQCVLPEKYHAGEASDAVWAKGVIEQMHMVRLEVELKEGIHDFTIRFLDGICTLEHLKYGKADCKGR